MTIHTAEELADAGDAELKAIAAALPSEGASMSHTRAEVPGTQRISRVHLNEMLVYENRVR